MIYKTLGVHEKGDEAEVTTEQVMAAVNGLRGKLSNLEATVP